MPRLEPSESDFYSDLPPGALVYPPVSPPSTVAMMTGSPPAQLRPQYYGPQAPATSQPRFGRRRASTSAAVAAAGASGQPGTAYGALPALQLTQSQANQLRAIETKLLEQYLERYDTFVEVNQRTVDTGLWKQTRQTNGVKVYKRRGSHINSRLSRDRAGRLGSQASSGETDEPMLLVVGSIDGTLEDVLYGAVWSSRDERSTRTHYTKDGIVDAAVLAALERASPMNPFRSLAVKWSLKRSMRSAAVIKDRDFVYLGSTGTIRSRLDERIGYELRHSLAIPSFPPIAGSSVIRAEIMSCSFFRQMRGGRVEVYHQASFEPGGDLLSILAWNHTVDAYIGFGAIVECSLTKKLVRAVQWSSENPPIKMDDDPEAKPWDPEDRRCGVCGTPNNSLQRKCALCHVWVCSHCSVRREIFTPLPGRPQVARCFCRTCLQKVQREDPTEYVLRELEQFEHRTATEYARSPEIAVMEPLAEDIPPPPPPLPPPPPSETAESVFFAIDASPPQRAARRRQGSMPPPPPTHPAPQLHHPARRASVTYSERTSERFANDENRAPNARRTVPTEHHERDAAAVGRTRRASAAMSSRATNASRNPGEILLRSDAEKKRWRHRELEQDQHAQRSSEAMPRRKTHVPGYPPDYGSGRRWTTVLGSELRPPPPPSHVEGTQNRQTPRMPERASGRHEYVADSDRRRSLDTLGANHFRGQAFHQQQAPLPPLVDRSSDRRSSIAGSGRRRSLDSMGSRHIRAPPFSQQPSVPTVLDRVPESRGGSSADSGRRSSLDKMDVSDFRDTPTSRNLTHGYEVPVQSPQQAAAIPFEPQLEDRSQPLKPLQHRSADIYRRIRAAGRPAPSTGSDAPSRAEFHSQYEELIPRSGGAVLGGAPLQERRQPALLPKPEPQALTARRPDSSPSQPMHSHQQQPRPPLSGRQPSRTPAPPRPEGPMQVRLSLLEKREMELLKLERKQQLEEEEWLRTEKSELERHTRQEQERPEQSDEEHDNQQEHEAQQRAAAREQDDLAVNSLLAELCEIARMTNEYTHSATSSMLATPASSKGGGGSLPSHAPSV